MTDDTEKLKAQIESLKEKNASLEEQMKGVTLKDEVEIGNEPQETAVFNDEGNERPKYEHRGSQQEFTTKQEVY